MREIDFLPDWYPAIQRRFRTLLMQIAVSIGLLLGLSAYAFSLQMRTLDVGKASSETESQIRATQNQLVEFDDQLAVEREWSRQSRMIAKLGVRIEPSRLMQALDEALPAEIALTSLMMEATDKVGVPRSSNSRNQIMRVSMEGSASTDAAVAVFMERLQKRSYFENINVPYIRAGKSGGQPTREFQLIFDLNLTSAIEDTP